MKLRIVAVGQRQPAWADAAYADFEKRFPPEMRLELHAAKAEPRAAGRSAEQLRAAEAVRLEAGIPRGARRVVLDERGDRVTTAQLALGWVWNNRSVAGVIGGPRTLAQWNDYLGALKVPFEAEDEAFVSSLVSPGHASTAGFNDPQYPIEGRVPKVG